LDISNWKEYCNTIKSTDKELVNFLSDDSIKEKTLDNFEQQFKISSNCMTFFERATKNVDNILKSFAASLGSMAASWVIGEVSKNRKRATKYSCPFCVFLTYSKFNERS